MIQKNLLKTVEYTKTKVKIRLKHSLVPINWEFDTVTSVVSRSENRLNIKQHYLYWERPP